MNRRRPCNRHTGQAVDVLCRILPRQRRERHPRQSVRNRALDHALFVHGSGLVVDHVRLVHPADVQRFAEVCLAYGRWVEAECDWSAASRRLAGHFGLERWDDGERGRDAGFFDDERGCEVEGVGGGDAGVEGRGVGYVADGVVAEEGVVAGFDREDGRGALHYLRVRESETGSHIDHSTDTDRGYYIGQGEKLVGTADGESVFAWCESGRVVRFQYPLGRLHVDELLRLHAPDDVDGVVVLVVGVPFGEILQPFKEEC